MDTRLLDKGMENSFRNHICSKCGIKPCENARERLMFHKDSKSGIETMTCATIEAARQAAIDAQIAKNNKAEASI